jgi:inorganic phosphate transporter, PiT family
MELAVAIALALAFATTNGLHDAANAIATLVATRGATPAQGIALSAVFNMLGAVLVGSAVANTVAGIIDVSPGRVVSVTGSALLAATLWNLATWSRGLPSSSGHALVGGLAGAALAGGGGGGGVNWGGLDGIKPVGVFGVLIALAVSPLLGFVVGFACERAASLVLRRATMRVSAPIRVGEWGMTCALSFSHGANDAQKSMGVIAAMLVATGHLSAFGVPLWVKIACGLMLTLGTASGGWRIVRTVGRRITRLSPVDGFASQSTSTAVILSASLVGGPVSTTQVVVASVVGVGAGHGRRRHVRWAVVRGMFSGWLLTLPASALLGAVTVVAWRAIA